VQGHLRKNPVLVIIKSECAHCALPITIELDEGLNYRVIEEGAVPLVFIPMINLKKLSDPYIIDQF